MYRYGAHTVLVDAATRGVATVAYADAGVQGRVAASLAKQFQGCIFVTRTIADYVSVSVRLLQQFPQAAASCAAHDEARRWQTSDAAASSVAQESRHIRLADGMAGLLQLMWEERYTSRDEAALAALVQGQRGAQ